MKRTALLLLTLLVPFAFDCGERSTTVCSGSGLGRTRYEPREELRCLVCQNETLADSRVDLANDLRGQIREQMIAGKSDKEIIAYLTDRYGKFILYNPPVDPTTYLLWFGPFVFLLAGLAFLFRYLKQRRELITEQPLSAAEHRRAETLLKSVQDKGAV